jgi:hypothetical protein
MPPRSLTLLSAVSTCRSEEFRFCRRTFSSLATRRRSRPTPCGDHCTPRRAFRGRISVALAFRWRSLGIDAPTASALVHQRPAQLQAAPVDDVLVRLDLRPRAGWRQRINVVRPASLGTVGRFAGRLPSLPWACREVERRARAVLSRSDGALARYRRSGAAAASDLVPQVRRDFRRCSSTKSWRS